MNKVDPRITNKPFDVEYFYTRANSALEGHGISCQKQFHHNNSIVTQIILYISFIMIFVTIKMFVGQIPRTVDQTTSHK